MYRYVMAIILAATMCCGSRAELIYSFRLTPSTTLVLPGLQSIDVFLDQTGTANDANLHTVGMQTANFSVTSSSTPVTFSSALTGFVDDGALTFASTDLTVAGTVKFSQTSLDTASLANGLLGTGNTSFASIKLGSFQFNLNAGESTTISTVPIQANDFALNNGTNINTIAVASLTITAVPEPSALALVGLTCFGATFLRRRK